jgi:hypothetical protein
MECTTNTISSHETLCGDDARTYIRQVRHSLRRERDREIEREREREGTNNILQKLRY